MVTPVNGQLLNEIIRSVFGGDFFGEGHNEVANERNPKPDPSHAGLAAGSNTERSFRPARDRVAGNSQMAGASLTSAPAGHRRRKEIGGVLAGHGDRVGDFAWKT